MNFELERNRLIGLAEKYHGEYQQVLKAIKEGEQAKGISKNCITILDDDYPYQLRELVNPPLVLFFKGDISLLKRSMCGIVGSREISELGKESTIYVANVLKEKYVIVSGLAKGVDAVAHSQSLNTGTIGVLGCGIDYIYPYENLKLYDNMIKQNLIISEYPFKTIPYAHHFPFRNRIISALSEFLVVTQAKSKSGTFITVNYALDLNKNIYVIPYHIFEEEGLGNNELIEEGANILTKDVLMYLQRK